MTMNMRRKLGKSSAANSGRLDNFKADIYRTIVEHLEQGVIVFDMHRIHGANKQFCDILSYPEELVAPGTPIEDFLGFGMKRGDYAATPELTIAGIRMRIAAAEDFVLVRQAPNGRLYRINGRYKNGVGVSTYTDITEETWEKAVLSNTLETIAQGLLVHDGDKILISNQRLLEVMDIPPEIVKPGSAWVDFIEYRSQRGDYDQIENYLQKAQNTQENFSSETRVGLKTIRVERRNANKMMFVTYTDVTDSKERERKLYQKEQEVRLLAETDGLTGLKNRRAFDNSLTHQFQSRLEGRISNTSDLALILYNLDHFRPVNDTYGHSFGDTLLKKITARISAIMHPKYIFARIDGDEFGAILEINDKSEAIKIANLMRGAAREPVVIDKTTLRVDASAGISYFSDGFENANAMFVGADLALSAAKNDTRGAVHEFKAEFAINAKCKYLLEQDLMSALENDELILYYQVQHDLASGSAVGYEALMRWQHPVKGLVSPAEFIPLAEETGMIVDIGRWALKQAARDFGGRDDGMRVAVNVSPVQFHETDLVDDIKVALNEAGLDPALLEIEITEAVLLKDNANTLKILEAIRALGVGLSLDDFGSGYSSLGYLTKYPFSKLKIDRSFIDQLMHDERSQALVSTILSLASTMGMKVTAEGVETQEQLDKLTQENCDEAQGFLLGRPKPLSDL